MANLVVYEPKISARGGYGNHPEHYYARMGSRIGY